MPTSNIDIARAFERLALLIELDGGDPFKIKAYKQAAFLVEGLDTQASDMLAQGRDLTEMPGIGKAIASKIQEMAETGTMAKLVEYEAKIPESLVELTKLPGLGPGRVHRLHTELGITGRAELLDAARAGKIQQLKGFGKKIEAGIMEALEGD